MDWEDVKTFRAVMASGTVRTAAKLLNVHHSTVSRRIDQLETALGCHLFERRPEGYFPTPAGEELARTAERFHDELLAVERQLAGRDDQLTGTLKVTAAEPIAVHLFAPRLPEFCAEYPGLDLQFLTGYELLDVARREADIAIRMDNNPPDTLVGKRLFAYCTSVYANPDYLAQHDFTNAPEAARWIGWSEAEGTFPEWVRDTEFAEVPVWGSFPNVEMQTRLAAAGMGLAMLPCLAGDEHPKLVRATSRPPTPSRDIWLLTHDDLRRTARVRAFMDFAERVLREARPALCGDTG